MNPCVTIPLPATHNAWTRASFFPQGTPLPLGTPLTPPPDSELIALVHAAAANDEEAWQQLWQRIERPLDGAIRGFHMCRISHDDDERRAVVLEVMARLRADDFRRLKSFLEARAKDEGLGLLPWIRVVARRVAIDHMRAHPNYVSGPRQDGVRPTGNWTDPKSLPPPSQLPGARPAMTRDGTAREVLEYARKVLPEEHFRAVALKMQGEEPENIARARLS
jgi:hypothetical protein